MNLQRLVVLLLVGLAVGAGCGKGSTVAAPGASATNAAPAPRDGIDPIYGHLLQAQPRLPVIKVLLGDPSAQLHELNAEVASKRVEIATGMMFRTNMPENEAMLFVFANAEPRSFYMRNCVVPLSAAYISPNGEILQIIDLQPGNERGVESRSDNVQFVLEVPQGWFSRHKVGLGGIVRTEFGSLKEIDLRKKP